VSVEEMKAALRSFYVQEASAAHIRSKGVATRDECVGYMDAAVHRLILAVRAEMPCSAGYTRDFTCLTGKIDNTCPSCTARKELVK
jgi:hypothetical protein